MTRDLEILLEAFPPESRAIIREMWGGLPADVRRELSLTLGGVVKLLRRDSKSANDLLEIMLRMAGPAVTPLTSVAIVGPVNAGKSTLYNRLVIDKNQKAEVSPVPGTTKVNQKANLGFFALVDTPGADHGAEVGEQERGNAYRAARDADFLLILLDASRGVTRSDKELFDDLRAMGKPFLVALNKVDLVTKAARQRVKEAAASSLGLEADSPGGYLSPDLARRGEAGPGDGRHRASASGKTRADVGSAAPQTGLAVHSSFGDRRRPHRPDSDSVHGFDPPHCAAGQYGPHLGQNLRSGHELEESSRPPGHLRCGLAFPNPVPGAFQVSGAPGLGPLGQYRGLGHLGDGPGHYEVVRERETPEFRRIKEIRA